ncbi:YiiD C-terminal domain-containing protein [Desulfosporosinus nitroreducens]|uniref:Thioesterase domain-containing protein n=1 Tax=Desulfosporosinus nitroreducens TaxID=2018668 RepID=A0ABT8QVQ9_9FIRM|nr:YiiD C-terminal domain-containing protein [Desulfosporosinus nitroreducens]MCO1602085.1 thioesterase domain-containing protein [Desulfosporosinus nitroreducens]MDO0825429.1 thioesterase domain-containing protein [Desulfosporosinus nitroreducens]
MDELAFQQLLYEQIPITEKMGFEVIEFKPSSVKILAKLEPNLNHKCTAFGGSINSLMTMCGWAAVFVNIKEFDSNSHIVIQRSNIEYFSPINMDFIAECKIEKQEVIEKLLITYKKFNRARIKLNVFCREDNKVLSKFEGQYVVFR